VTGGYQPALPGAGATVVRAGECDLEVLSQVIADAFHDLAVSQWLIPDPDSRREIFPGYFAIFVQEALEHGVVHTTPDRCAAALWIPSRHGPGTGPADYDRRVEEVTGPWAAQFRLLDAALSARLPSFRCQHLAMLGVRPDRQHRGIGAALLDTRHRELDQPPGDRAYLEASSPQTRTIYRSHGYLDHGGPIELLDGPSMYPMLRTPSVPSRRGQLR
jgi:GNAT superfamily N-acetyltransferase